MSSAAPCEVSTPISSRLSFLRSYAPFASELLTSGVSVGVATCATNPVDVVKIRLQVASAGSAQLGIVGTGVDLVRSEGPLALFKGLTPSVARGVFYGGLRLGLYGPIKSVVTAEGEKPNVLQKMTAGCSSGALAAAITNPTDLVQTLTDAVSRLTSGWHQVKTRLQTKGSPHSSSVQVIRHIVGTDGVLGLWKGTVPSAVRAAALTASQCVSYDIIKRQVLSAGMPDTFGTHFVSSMLTGLITTTITSPVDVIKTRMFVAGSGFAGPWDCALSIWANDGFAGFFKGWTANYARLGPQTMIIFVVAEQLRHLAGLKAM